MLPLRQISNGYATAKQVPIWCYSMRYTDLKRLRTADLGWKWKVLKYWCFLCDLIVIFLSQFFHRHRFVICSNRCYLHLAFTFCLDNNRRRISIKNQYQSRYNAAIQWMHPRVIPNLICPNFGNFWDISSGIKCR